MTEEKEGQAPAATGDGKESGRFAELDELQREVARRIQDNQRFLQHFLDDDFDEPEEADEVADPEDDFEEL